MSSLPSQSSSRILIADDESLIRLDLREMLVELGYDVVGEAGDGRSALDLARKLRPDLVIMDIRMPGGGGISAAGAAAMSAGRLAVFGARAVWRGSCARIWLSWTSACPVSTASAPPKS